MYSSKSLPLAVSHRGLHDTLPENSIPAFEAAIAAGAEGIELDIHGSADGVLHVHHDPTLDVNGGPVPFTALDSRDIAKLRLEGDVPIPTLDDTLASIGSRASVFIEVKASGIETDLARCLRRHSQNAERYAVHAFDHRVVKRMLELIPAIRTGILQVSYLVDSTDAMRRAGAVDLWQHADFIDEQLVTDIHARGGRVVAWTPNGDSQWEKLSSLGVDATCTDRIDDYVSWRTERA
jgi:glycerophosphoryl diester phosphodiesterase